MPKTTPTLKHSKAYQAGMLAGLVSEVAELRAEIAALREQIIDEARTSAEWVDDFEAQLATEVRTRRLVVVDANGFERVVAETSARADSGSLTVASPKDVSVTVIAAEQCEDAFAQVYLSGGGNTAATFEVREDGDRDEPDSLYYRSELTLIPDDGDPRFHPVTLGREGLHYGG